MAGGGVGMFMEDKKILNVDYFGLHVFYSIV